MSRVTFLYLYHTYVLSSPLSLSIIIVCNLKTSLIPLCLLLVFLYYKGWGSLNVLELYRLGLLITVLTLRLTKINLSIHHYSSSQFLPYIKYWVIKIKITYIGSLCVDIQILPCIGSTNNVFIDTTVENFGRLYR